MATLAPRRPVAHADRWFFSSTALLMLALVFVGFAPSYYLSGIVGPPPGLKPATTLVHIHAFLFSGWMLLFVLQTQLVAWRRTDLHRMLGTIGFVMLPAMILIAALSALYGVHRGSGPPMIPPLTFLAVPLLDIPVFALLIGGALANRRIPQTHKRLMFIAMIGMMSPAIGRMPLPPPFVGPVAIFALPDVFLLALVLFDLMTLGRVHRATLWGGLLLVSSQILRVLIWETESWLAFARWASGLVA
ncbi:hypothetical protein [Sphingosinicella microcystinivorans]|uniref:Uncharacterized protein n=1 Tax=Sphingosinicella microcystinivorans TaxID=335406 RepID=A0AAD1D6Z2_SPHMI|nr:hypothetical protein [Sphingosinicella microcystinivorans]RKS90996.1 hypothetical protein DFR51_0541 [Sphingosinicella microcystinivorans]BBE33916.1 hypothetical protein SmB9_15740 [Sphingosinicella microcystinivorans]